MKNIILFSSLYLLLLHIVAAQQTVTISTGDRWMDAVIYQDTRSGYSHIANRNYGTYSRISATAWSSSGSSTYWRNLLYFKLDVIPSGSTIHSATLYFYSDPAVTSSSAYNGNSQLSGSNAFYLEKITGEWHESSVTWNNQPTTSTSGRIWVGASSSSTENRQINIKSMVQNWVNNPTSNAGLMMKLENELKHRSRNYVSTNHSKTNLHPRLIVSYTPPVTTHNSGCATPDPTEEEYKKIPWYDNETYLPKFYDSLQQAQSKKSTPIARIQGDIDYPWLRIPIKLWIYQIGAGNPGGNPATFPDERRIQRMVDNLNNGFKNNGIKLRFYLEDVSFVNDAGAINVGGFGQQYRMAYAHRDLDAINIHVVDELENSGGVYNPLYNAIFIERITGNDPAEATRFTHEVGHYFGLFHTHMFNGVFCLQEPVTRGRKITACPGFFLYPRCSATGDLLCDTPADPRMSRNGAYNDATCTWDALGTRDIYGEIFRPDTRNFMATGNRGNPNDPCRTHFSTGQRNVIYFYTFMRQYKHTWIPTNNNRFDRYEPDDASNAARNINLSVRQGHSFHVQGRRDEVDWLRFEHLPTVNSGRYFLDITEIDGSAVGAVNIFLGDGNGNPVTRVGGITSTVNGNTQTFTIPCASLTVGGQYLIEIRRGSAGTVEYEVELRRESTGPVPTVTGDPAVCTSNTTYTLNNLPPGATVTWTRSNNLTYVSGQGTTRHVVRAASGASGVGWVEAVVNGTCGGRQAFRKELNVGGIASSQIRVSGQTAVCGGNQYVYTATPYVAGYTYNWTFPANWMRTSQSGNQITLNTPSYSTPDGGTVSVSITNSCGASPYSGITVYPYCYGSYSFAVSPNPANEQIAVEQVFEQDTIYSEKQQPDIASLEEAPLQEDFSIKLFDKNQKEVSSAKAKKRNAVIDTRKLPAGIYYLNIFYNEEVLQKQIIIEK